MPRIRGLLSLRAVNSLKNVFGANHPASLTVLRASAVNVSLTTAVTLTGRFCGSSGCFCAVTVIGGNVVVSVWPAAGADAARARKAPAASDRLGIGEFSHIFWGLTLGSDPGVRPSTLMRIFL